MDLDPRVPPQLGRLAHVAGNGELLWPPAAAADVARWLAAGGLAIWGGEVFEPRGPFSAVMVHEWRTEPDRRPSEEWDRYVARSLTQALETICRHAAAAAPLYFLAYCSPTGSPGGLHE